MATVEVFDPPMCCSSGVCGPDPEAQLVHFAADLDWLHTQGVEVRRYNLFQEPLAFAGNAEIKRLLEETDSEGLPAILVDGKLVGHGSYPSRDDLARWAGVVDGDHSAETGALTLAVTELIAIGAAVASNCEACFKYHFSQARKLGVSKEEMLEAVNIALRVKAVPAGAMVQLTQKLLLPDDGDGSSECCGGDTEEEKKCC